MSEDSQGDFVTREMFEKVKAESISRKERIRELEPQLQSFEKMGKEIINMRVENELLRRGIQAEPDWVRVPEGGNVAEAVDSFLTKYPHLSAPLQNQVVPEFEPGITQSPSPLSVNQSNPHSPGPPAQGTIPAWSTPSGLDAIEKDPKARSALQEQYREWLTN